MQDQASLAEMEGHLVQKLLVPTPQFEVYGIDSFEGRRARVPMSRPGALGNREKDPGCPLMPMPGKSPRSTADTCPSMAIQPNLIESRALSHQDLAHRRSPPIWKLHSRIPHQ